MTEKNDFDVLMDQAVSAHAASDFNPALDLRLSAYDLALHDGDPIRLGRVRRDIAASLQKGADSARSMESSVPIHWADASIRDIGIALDLKMENAPREMFASKDRKLRIVNRSQISLERSEGYQDGMYEENIKLAREIDSYLGYNDPYFRNAIGSISVGHSLGGDRHRGAKIAQNGLRLGLRNDSGNNSEATYVEKLSLSDRNKILVRSAASLIVASSLGKKRLRTSALRLASWDDLY